MELRRYWDLLRRRGWIPLVLMLVTAVLSLLLTTEIQKSYSATVRYVVMSPPQAPAAGFFNFDSYYNWLGSEYMGDDLTELVKSKDFIDAVRKEVNDPTVNAEDLIRASKATRTHRLLSIVYTSGSEYQTTKVAAAVVAVLPSTVSQYFPSFGPQQPFFRLVDPPATKPSLNGPRIALEVGLRVALALVVGLTLMLVLDYLDTSIRNANDVELLLDLPIVGEIPPDN